MNPNEPVSPSAEVDRRTQELYQLGHAAFSAFELKQAEDSFAEVLRLLEEDQKEKAQRIHKGAPFHYLGIVNLLGYRKPDKAVVYFIKAYVEDVLSAQKGHEGDADGAPAASILKPYSGFTTALAPRIKELAKALKSEGKLILDPQYLLDEIPEYASIEASLLREARKTEVRRRVDNLPGRWERRVFIGGDYEMYSRLLDIANVVVEEQLVPILAREFLMPEELIRHHTLLLLHNCKLAIFEVSKDAGQLTEIERLSDYEIVPLFLYDAAKSTLAISAMVRSHRLFRDYSRGYNNTDELRKLVREFLQAHK